MGVIRAHGTERGKGATQCGTSVEMGDGGTAKNEGNKLIKRLYFINETDNFLYGVTTFSLIFTKRDVSLRVN